VFDAEAMTHVDSTGLAALEELTSELRRDGIALVVTRLRTRMYEELDRASVVAAIGPDRFYPTVRAAVDACAQAASRPA
jgi:MFS superfamily sulfate permease-like transporter